MKKNIIDFMPITKWSETLNPTVTFSKNQIISSTERKFKNIEQFQVIQKSNPIGKNIWFQKVVKNICSKTMTNMIQSTAVRRKPKKLEHIFWETFGENNSLAPELWQKSNPIETQLFFIPCIAAEILLLPRWRLYFT